MISGFKTPNLKEAARLAAKTVVRFPLATLCGLVGTIAMCYVIEVDYQDQALKNQLTKLILVTGLGISFFAALQLFGENLKNRVIHYGVLLAGLALLVIYYLTLPQELRVVQIVRYILLFLAAHLLVSFAPYIPKYNAPGFWSYNKQLFLQILTAFFFSMVLFAGLALALAAVENLFDIDVKNNSYAKLFFIMTGIFSMLYFLGGVPQRDEVPEDEKSYSKGLSIFTQYILIPLVGIYTIILYLYTLKIIIQWDWPRGWIAYLFVSYAILGILSYLLIYPMASEKSKVWLRTFLNGFFISLVPLAIVLFLAIYRRVAEYGLTENRYFLFVLDFWLFGIAAYFIFSKAKNIKFIPLTLAVVVLLSSFGPWGAFSMSVRNQVSRFESLLSKKTTNEETLKFEEKKNISSILTYLKKRNRLNKLQPHFSNNIDSLLTEKNANPENILLGEYKLNYINEWEKSETGQRQSMNFTTIKKYHVNIHHTEFLQYQDYQSRESKIGGLMMFVDHDNMRVQLKDSLGWQAEVDLEPLVERLKKLNTAYGYDMEPEKMAIDGTTKSMDYKLYVKSLNLDQTEQGKYKLHQVEFDLFFTRKR